MANKAIFHLVFVVLVAIVSQVQAADIEKSQDSGRNDLVLLQGRIAPGDTQKLAQFLLKAR